MYFDDYGYPDEEKAITFLLNEMKKLEDDGDTRGLSSFKRKNPMNFKMAFSADGASALYDPELINTQLDDIIWRQGDITERGDLVWKDGFEFLIEKNQTYPRLFAGLGPSASRARGGVRRRVRG